MVYRFSCRVLYHSQARCHVINCFFLPQVSDIHVSRYYGQQRAPDLAKFCDSEVNVIQPELVIASGKVYILPTRSINCMNKTV